jgi:hypothetical protein
LHKNLFVLTKHKIPFVFARVLGVKRWLTNSYKYAIGYNITSGLKKKGKIILLQATMAYEGREVLLHSSFTSALDGSGQSQTLPLYLRTH